MTFLSPVERAYLEGTENSQKHSSAISDVDLERSLELWVKISQAATIIIIIIIIIMVLSSS